MLPWTFLSKFPRVWFRKRSRLSDHPTSVSGSVGRVRFKDLDQRERNEATAKERFELY